MTATLQLDELHTLIDHHATRHELDGEDFGPAFGDAEASVTLYQLIPLREHPRPWIVHVQLRTIGDETITHFDSQREAEAAYAREIDSLTDWYGDDDDDWDED